MSQIIEFLSGTGKDHRGRTLEEVLQYDDSEFDHCHDFIQWMFPLPKASNHFKGGGCPVITMGDMIDIRNSVQLQENLIKNVEKFLKFLGFEVTWDHLGNATVDLSESFPEQVKYWLRPRDHNHLRINRMIQCLVLSDQEELAKSIFRTLVMIKCEFDDWITDETMVYWRNALTGYSY